MKKHLLPSFGIIGGGAWRAQFYLRIARDLPGIFPFAGFVDRDPEKRTKISQKWGLPVYASIEELLDKGKPDFVVTTVPWSENLPVVKELSQSKVATLSETPVAPTMAELKQMSQLVTKGAKIQVAEQYPFSTQPCCRTFGGSFRTFGHGI